MGEQFRILRRFRGRAFVYYFERRDDNKQGRLLAAMHYVHRCRETVVAYGDGSNELFTTFGSPLLLPRLAISALYDVVVFCATFLLLHGIARRIKPVQFSAEALDKGISRHVGYLFPFPFHRFVSGGAVSHIRGVIGGMLQNQAHVAIYSGAALPVDGPNVNRIATSRAPFLTVEAATLLYNLTFARDVRRRIDKQNPPALLYQRHGRFVVAGALLSRALRIPLVLEYNGSELWVSKHWDPTRFSRLLELCESIALSAATKIIVVSQASVDELAGRGVARSRIVLNPNAVDPDIFRPGCGGAELRKRLGFTATDVVCGFVGTFSYWHGIPVLEQAINRMLQQPGCQIKFLLVGDGMLRAEMHARLARWIEAGQVVFTGTVNPDVVASYLDATDILLSPHVPLQDGTPFFGSPTKLFEYMAAGKCVIASALDQIAEVLVHMQTGLLVEPGNSEQLATAIMCAAGDPELRHRLGKKARNAAIGRHTWKQNAATVFECVKASAREWTQA
jgi:glycosyltransferase involved in cell wall biosynthesis